MGHKFVVGIRNKEPYLIEGDKWIVMDNDDYTLELVPDSEWDAYPVKTVLYVFDNGKYVTHPIEGNEDTLPVITTSGKLHIGVTAGEVRTTTWVTIPIKPSIRRKGWVQIPEPEPDVYDTIMEMISSQFGKGVANFTKMTKNAIGSGTTGYTFLLQLVDGTMYNVDVPTQATALRLERGVPTSSDAGAGAYNSPFWLDKDTGYLYNYVGQNAMYPAQAEWEMVRGRPQVTSGEGAPTTSTVGEKDDLYVDSTNKCLYWCSGWEYSTAYPGTKEYSWVQIITTITISGGGTIDGPGTSDSPGTTALKAVYDSDTGELTVTGGTVTYDSDTGNLTITGTPQSYEEETGNMSIGG